MSLSDIDALGYLAEEEDRRAAEPNPIFMVKINQARRSNRAIVTVVVTGYGWTLERDTSNITRRKLRRIVKDAKKQLILIHEVNERGAV